jgi:hypothetical protein
MKVQILQLDAHDDLASARDKLAWAQAQRVVLVWPDRARLLRKQLDLVLLRRQAARQGIELGLVTRDPVVLEHAATLGLPCFRSSTRLPEEIWKTARGGHLALPARPEPRAAAARPPQIEPRTLPGWLRAAVLTLLGLVLSAAAILLLPGAVIAVHPGTNEQTLLVTFSLSPRVEAPDALGNVPARQVTVEESGTIRVTTTGETLVPGAAAAGEVVFTNLTDLPVIIPAGTGVLPAGRPDLRFVTAEEVSLPAGQGEAASTVVTAVHPGPDGNLPDGSINAIDGPLGLQASVTQPGPTTGGTQVERAAVSPADQTAALSLLTEQLLSQAASEIEASLSGDEALSATSLRVTRTPHREYDRTVGEAADSVGLRLTVEVAGLIYREQDVDAAAALVVAAQLPAGSAAVPGSLEWSPAASAPPSPELLTARVRQLWFQPVAVDAVQRAVRGRRPAEAAANLASLPGQAQPAEVKLAPAWWPVVPWLDVRTRVVTPWEQQ